MASAVVGSLRVLLEVNASHLESEFDKATVKISAFDKFTQNAGRSLNRMVDEFSGAKLVAQAQTMSAAIEKIGGVSMLTDRELQRVAATVGQATDKLRAMGAEVPPGLQKIADELKGVATVSDTATFSFGKFVAGLVTAEAIIGAVKGAFSTYLDFIRSSIDSYANAEAAQTKLTAAITAQGTATPTVIQQYAGLADQFQKTTVFADDLLMEMQALLVQVGDVMPDQMESALEAATNLASGLGIDLRTATMLVGKAFEGEVGTLKRYGIVIDETKLKTQGVTAVLDAVQERFGGQAAAQVDTYAGTLLRMANAWDNVKEQVGEFAVKSDEVQNGLKALNLLLDQMNTAAAGATTPVAKLWEVWQQYIKIGQTITPGVAQFHRLLGDLADEADRVAESSFNAFESLKRFHDEIKKNALKPLTMDMREYNRSQEDLTRGAQKLIDQRLEEAIKKAAAEAKKAAEAQQKWLESIRATTTAFSPYVAGLRDAGQELQNIAKGLEGNGNLLSRTLNEAAQNTAEADRAFRAWAATNGILIPTIKAVGSATTETASATEDATVAAETWRDGIGSLAQALSQLAQVSGESFSEVARWLATVVGAMDVANKSADQFKKGLDTFKSGDRAAGFTQMAAGALSLVAALHQATAATNKFQGALAGVLAMAGTGNVWLMLAGGVYGYIRGLTSAQEAQRLFGVQFRKDLGALRAEAMAVMQSAWVIGLDDDLRRLLDTAETQLDLERIAELIDLIKTQYGQLQADAGGLFDDLMALADEAGGIPASMRNLVENFRMLGILTDEQEEKLRTLGDSGTVSLDKMNAAADVIKARFESLGPAFNQQRLNQDIMKVVNAIGTLIKGGADVGGVLFDARDEVSALVRESIKFRTTVPANMKEWIDHLFATNNLLDENGEAITDISQIKYGEPLKTEAEKITEAFKTMTDKLLAFFERLGQEILRIPDRQIKITADYDDSGLPPEVRVRQPGDDESHPMPVPMARGGLVSHPTVALLGEAGAELVTPLSRIPQLLGAINPSAALAAVRANVNPSVSAFSLPETGRQAGAMTAAGMDERRIASMLLDLWRQQSDVLMINVRDAVRGAV